MSGGGDGESFLIIFGKRIKSNANGLFFIILSKNFMSCYRRHKSGNALLTVYQNFLSHRAATIFEFYIGILPDDEIACRITIVKRVYKVTNLLAFPNERSLYFWDSNITGFNVAKYGADRILCN